MKTIVSVNRQALAKGEPGISIKRGGKTIACYEAVFYGGMTLVIHDPKKKRQPRAWIETTADVQVVR